jgi:two-component system response regulator MprA
MSVLVVDDDVRSARTLANMLREDGWIVDIAIDGVTAIARLSRAPLPSVLVTDLHLPSADGNVVSRYARAQKADMPIIIVTGYPERVGNGLHPKPIVLTKPIDYAQLSATLERLTSS